MMGQILGALLAIGIAFLSLFNSNSKDEIVSDELIPRLCPLEYPQIDPPNQDCDNWDGESGYSYDFQIIVNELICTFIFVTVRLVLKVQDIKVTTFTVSEALGTSLSLLAMLKTGNKLGVC